MTESLPLRIMISGPHDLPELSLVVESPRVAVVFRNGLPVLQVGPGRHWGVFNRLPVTGIRKYLLFDCAPFSHTLAISDLRLSDGSRVALTCDVMVRPLWNQRENQLLSLASQYGVEAHRYIETWAFGLQDAFVSYVLRALTGIGHDELVTTDLRSLLFPSQISTPLAEVMEILTAVPTRDPHFDALVDVDRSAELQAREQIHDIGRRQLEHELELTLQRKQRLSAAELDVVLSRIYETTPWAVAHPELSGADRLAQRELVHSLLTEYADVLPELAASSDTDVLGVLQAVLGHAHPTSLLTGGGAGQQAATSPGITTGMPSGVHAQRSPTHTGDDVAWAGSVHPDIAHFQHVIPELGAAHSAGMGGYETAAGVVACVATTSSTPTGARNHLAPGWNDLSVAELKVISVPRSRSAISAGQMVLNAALDEERAFGASVFVQRTGPHSGRLIVTVPDSELSDDLTDRLTGWAYAISQMSEPDEIEVSIQVGR